MHLQGPLTGADAMPAGPLRTCSLFQYIHPWCRRPGGAWRSAACSSLTNWQEQTGWEWGCWNQSGAASGTTTFCCLCQALEPYVLAASTLSALLVHVAEPELLQ